MNGVFGNPPLDVPEWPTLPVPSGAGTTLPVPTAEVLRAPTPPGLQLPPRPGSEAPSTAAGFNAEGLPMILAALADLAARATGKQSNQLGTIATLQGGRLAAQREERAGRTEERAVKAEERATQTAALEATIKLQTAQRQETNQIMTDALGYLQGSEGLSAAARDIREDRLLTRMAKTSPEDVATLRTILADRTFAEDIEVLTPRMSPREIADLQTNARFLLTKEGGKKGLRDMAESFASDEVVVELRNRAFTVSRRLRAEGKTGVLDRDALRTSLADSGSKAELALFEGTRFSEEVRKAGEEIVTGVGFAPRGLAGDVAKKVTEEQALGPVKTEQKVAETKALLAPEIVEATAKKEAAVKLAVKTAEQQFAATTPLTASEAGTIRGQFLTQAKDFSDTIRAYQRVEDAVKDPSAAGDIAVLFGYMKMLDPGSVVRESEFATAANAAGVPEQIRNAWNRLMTGQRLGEAGAPTREDIADRSRRLVAGQLDLHEQTERAFRGIAKKRKGEAEEVVPDIVGTDLRKRIKEGPRGASAAKPGEVVIEFVRDPKTGRLVPKKK